MPKDSHTKHIAAQGSKRPIFYTLLCDAPNDKETVVATLEPDSGIRVLTNTPRLSPRSDPIRYIGPRSVPAPWLRDIACHTASEPQGQEGGPGETGGGGGGKRKRSRLEWNRPAVHKALEPSISEMVTTIY